MSAEKIYRSTPLTVEDGGVAERIQMRKWKVRMVSGHEGICWTPAFTDEGSPCPCPFVQGKHCAFTVKEEEGKTAKLRPYDMTEYDRQEVISRQACLNTAASLISAGAGASTVENLTGIAQQLLDWVHGKQ